MLKENQAEFDILGITRCHELSIMGNGIKMANLESCYPAYFLRDQLKPTFQYNIGKSTNSHGQKTMDVINQVMPKAELYSLSNATSKIIIDTLPFILKNNIDIVSASLTSTNTAEKDNLIKQCIANGTIFTAAAGNVGEKGIKGYPKNPLFLAVTAVHFDEEVKKIYKANYSSMGPEAFITCFSNLWLRNAEDMNKLIPAQQGTSFSNPLFAGMIGLVQEYFSLVARKLTPIEMSKFVLDNVIDLGVVGRDAEYGHGLFVIPELSDIDIMKYITADGPITPPIIIPEPVEIPEEVEEMTFKDTEGHWAKEYIDYVVAKGYMKGNQDGTFDPEGSVTRAEFAVVLARINGFVPVKKQ